MTARILYIEDEPELREDLTIELRDAGYHVIEAGDGMEALALLMAEPVDLVLCDIQLPRLNGFEVLRQTRDGGQANTATPFIMLTAYGDTLVRGQGAELGAQGFLVKPVDYEELFDLIAGILAEGSPAG